MKYLDYYAQPDANADEVLIGVTDLVAPSPSTSILHGSDAALQTQAETDGDSTWDQDTICTVYNLTRKPSAVIDPMPFP